MPWFRRSPHPNDEELSSYLDSEVAVRRGRALAGHVSACAVCRAQLDELRTAKALLSSLPRVETARSFALGREYAFERPRPAPRRPVFAYAPAVALTLLVALFAFDALSPVSTVSQTASHASDNAVTAKSASSGATASSERALQLPSPAAGAFAQPPPPSAPAPAAPGPIAIQPQSAPVVPPAPPVTSAANQRPAEAASGAAAPTPPPPIPSPPGVVTNAQPPPGVTNAPAAATNTSQRSRTWLHVLEAMAAVGFVASLIVVYGPWIRARLKGEHPE